MQERIEEVSPAIRQVEVELSAAEVDSLMDDAVREYGKNLVMDGFRAGSVPPDLVEKRFAKEVFGLAERNLLDRVLSRLAQEHEVYPVNRVDYAECALARGRGCLLCLRMEVIPRFPLPEKLTELSVRVKAPVVDPKEFFAALLRLRQIGGELLDVLEDRYPQDGDVAFLDVRANCAGRPVPGLCAQNLALRLGGNESHPELGRVARGLKIGERGAGAMPCPEDYPDPDLIGREIQLAVRLRDLKREILPALDDALALKLGKKDLRGLQEDIYKELLNKVIVRNRREAEENLLESLLEPLEFEPPPSLITIHRKTCLAQTGAFLQKLGFRAGEVKLRLARMADEAERAAAGRAKAQAFLMALAYREKLTVSKDELGREIAKLARHTHADPAGLESELYGSKAIYELQDQLLADKALRHLYTKAQKIVSGEVARSASARGPQAGGEEPE